MVDDITSNKRSFCFAFTWNNPDSTLDVHCESVKNLKVCSWQGEFGEGTEDSPGQYHYQGFVSFTSKIYLRTCIKWWGIAECHFQYIRKSPQAAYNYTRKEGTRVDGPYQFGDWTPGARNDIWDIQDMVKTGVSDREIYECYPEQYMRYGNMINKTKFLYVPVRREKSFAILWLGATGSYKSTLVKAMEDNDPENGPYYWKEKDSKWWELYDGRSPVVIDEFKGWIKYSTFLNLLDHTPCMVQCKHGHIQFNPKFVIVMSSLPPIRWWKKGVMKEIMRRFDVVHYKEGKEWNQCTGLEFYEAWKLQNGIWEIEENVDFFAAH